VALSFGSWGNPSLNDSSRAAAITATTDTA